MDNTPENTASEYFHKEYSETGFAAQRRYPNEEFCRFMGRNFFSLPLSERHKFKILETGCGSGANLWMAAREGFSAIGVDLSSVAIELCEKMLSQYDCEAELHVSDMTDLPIEEKSIDAVVDIFSSHCLNQKQGDTFLKEVIRVLKPGGKFFSYFPSTRSDTWTKQNHPDPDFLNKIDSDTLNGLHRETGPYFGNNHHFRFLSPQRYRALLMENKFSVDYCETISRTYQGEKEVFEFVVIEASKN